MELHPETRNGGDRKTADKNQNDTMSFCSDTSKKTGKSKRTTERKVAIGEKLGGMQDAIKAAGIDDSQIVVTIKSTTVINQVDKRYQVKFS